MIANSQKIVDLIKRDHLSLAEVRRLFDQTGSSPVSIQDWGASYSSQSGEMSEYCELGQSADGSALASVGLLAYSSDGKTLYCAQYTIGFDTPYIFASASTSRFDPDDNSVILGVLFGSTMDGKSFFYEEQLTVVPAQIEAGA